MFSPDVERALEACLNAHAGQLRKDSSVPYAVHPLHVALMLSRWGLDESVILAGLLHDVVEDSEDWTVERVEAEFGKHVASIVGELTEDKSLSWEQRKRAAVEHAAHLSPQAAAVKAVDKLHNLQALVLALRASPQPERVWARFNGGRRRTLEMDGELVRALQPRLEAKLARSLVAAWDALQRWCTEHPERVEADARR